MAVEVVAEECPNCGAPLDVDAGGTCRWCAAHVWRAPTRAPEDLTIVEAVRRQHELQLCGPYNSLPLPAYPLLAGLSNLTYDPAVQQFLDQPALLETARTLTAVVQAAGERIRDAGRSDEMLPGERSYTPDDWWAFDLGFDLLVVLLSLPGVTAERKALALDDVRSNDRLWHDHARKRLRKAGDGPGALRPLRAFIPHRAAG